MKKPFQNKILITIICYLIIISIYWILIRYFNSRLPNWGEMILALVFPVSSIILLFEIVRRKRNLYKKASYKITFFLSLIPGGIFAIFPAYGLFGMGHGFYPPIGDVQDLINFLSFDLLYIFIIFFSLISGLLGLSIDFVWNLWERARNK